MSKVKGWSNVSHYRCRAAHYVLKGTVAWCGAPIVTLVPSKKHPKNVCDRCQAALRKVAAAKRGK